MRRNSAGGGRFLKRGKKMNRGGDERIRRQEIGKRSCGHESQKRPENGFVVFLERSDNASDAEKEAGKCLR
jgi:hypothetical protein